MKKIFLFLVLLVSFGVNAFAFTVEDIPSSFSFSSLSYNPYWGNSKNKQSDIRYLQIVLNEDPKTHAGISTDGIFGQGTHNALVSFQGNYGLSTDGIAGSNTKRELDEVLQSLKNSNNNCQPELQLDRDSIKINTSINQSIIHGNDNIHVSAQVYNNSFDCKSNQYSITVKYAGRTSSKNDVPYENSFKTKSSKVYAAINPRQYGGTEQSKNFSIDNLSGTHWLKVCVSTAKNLYGDDCEYKTFDVVASSNTQESPRPNISIVPSAIVPHVGQLFEITAKAVNKGGASNDGYITVSFPDYTDPKDKDSLRIISAENGVQTYIKRKGDTIFDKNLQSMEADCLMVELRDTNWQKNETHELKFKLLVKDTPTNFIRVFYRSTMKDKSTGKYINYPSSSIKTDQQEWSCKDKNIKIIEKAKSTLFDAKSKFLGKSNNALLNLYKAEVFLANTIYGESTLFVDDGVPLYYDKNKYAELIGYRYNQENGFVGGLYRVNDNDKGEPKYVLAYGGTSAKDAFEDKSSLLKDILTDINLLNKNKKSIQVSDAYNFYSKMKQKFHLTKHNTTITGHSLGGGLAQYVSYLTGIKAITINTAPIPISWLDSNYMLKKVDIINFMAENDPLTTILTNFEDIEVGYHVSSKPIRHQGYLDLIDAFCADSMISIGGIYILDDFAISQNMNLIDFHLAITAFAIHENKKAFLYLKNALGIEDYSLKDLILGQRISISNSATSSSGHSIEKFINAVYNFDDLTKEKLIDYVNSGISGKLHKTPSLKNIQKYSSRAYSAQKVSKSYRVASSTGVGSSSSNPLMADSLTPTLVFSDFDNFTDGGTHTATWFDVRRNDDRKFLYDSGWKKGDIAQAQIPEGYLDPNTVYRVRLVYQDSRGKLTKVGYGYFKTEVITKPEVKHTTIDFIGQTGAMVIADIDTYNDPSTKAYISFNSSGLNLIDLKQDQKKIYYSVKNLQCNTNYYYIVTLEDSHGNYGYSDKKFFKTLPCASQVQLTAKDGSALIAFPKTKVGECSTGKVLLKKLDSIYDATGELSFSDILKDNSAFEIVDGSYSLSYKGETKEKEIKFCPTKEGEQMAFVQLKKGNIEFESYPTLVFVSGEGVEADSANFKNNFYLSDATVDKTELNAGESFRVSVKQKYSGDATESQRVYVGYYLSKDRQWSSDDTYLGYDVSTVYNNDLYDDESETLQIPSDTVKGDYYILFVADYKKQYDETNENDNVAYIRVTLKDSSKKLYTWNRANEICLEQGKKLPTINELRYALQIKETPDIPIRDGIGYWSGTQNKNGMYYYVYGNDSTQWAKSSSSMLRFYCVSESLDSDNDGVADINDSFPFDTSEWLDTDGDGIGNNADYDDDGDGVPDTKDDLPLNPHESVDTDHDGTGNNADTDDDNDGISDVDERRWGFDPLDASDGGNVDADGDGVSNADEIEAGSDPLDPNDTKKPKRYVPILSDDTVIMVQMP